MIGQSTLVQEKKDAALRAMAYIKPDMVIGVGTGSTTYFFIEALGQSGIAIEGAVASSVDTEKKLKQFNIPVMALNHVIDLPVYVDGADEFNDLGYLIKGGGGALTREKIIAQAAKQFICVVDSSKYSKQLGKFPVAIEVIPMARSFVARQLIQLGGDPIYRENFITDNGNIILDLFHTNIQKPIQFEETLNNIPGIVCHGLFAKRPADKILIGKNDSL